MSIGKMLKNAFFEEEVSELDKNVNQPVNNVGNPPQFNPINVVNYPPAPQFATPNASVQNPEELTKFRNYFNDLFKKLNLEGSDFYEFYQLLNSENMMRVPDVNNRLIASFGALSYQGLTKEKLLTTVKFYTDALLKDKETYTNVINEKIKNESQIKSNKIESNKKEISDIDKQIMELTNKKQTLFVENSTIEQSISDDTLKDRSNILNYETVFNEFTNNINNTVNLINSNL